MSTNSMDLLSEVSFGTIVAWITTITGVIGMFCTGTIKLYKIFCKYKNMKDLDESLKKKVEKHEIQLEEIKEQLNNMSTDFLSQFNEIKDTLKEQRNTKITELRHNITEAGEKALSDKTMSIRQWTSLHEMFDTYKNKYGQNSYVQSLIVKVDSDVKVLGKIDEHGQDVE